MIYPPLLKHGDKVAIVAPAGKLDHNALDNVVNELNQWGLEVILGDNVYGNNGYFSGTDEERLFDLQSAINNKSVAAILAARGGYGVTRILENLNFNSLSDNPKWLIGFSDLTAIHLKLLSLNIPSIHGPMGTSFNLKGSGRSVDALKNLIFNGISSLTSNNPSGREGLAEGLITGGNLALLADSLGTQNEVDTVGKILFLEEVGEKTYRVDRMLHQLKRAGKFDQLAGLVVGDFSDIEDGETAFGNTWKQSIENITETHNYPVAFGFELGHEAINIPLISGGEYELNVKENFAALTLKTQLS